MGIESRRIRTWLAASISTSLGSSRTSQEAIAEPPTYIASFNPFPALVIGVTGAAMAAHAQTYLFQVRHFRTFVNLSDGRLGSNSPTLGKLSRCICGSTVLHILLSLARSSAFHPSFTSSDGSSRRLLPRLWRFSIHVLDRRGYIGCYAARS